MDNKGSWATVPGTHLSHLEEKISSSSRFKVSAECKQNQYLDFYFTVIDSRETF